MSAQRVNVVVSFYNDRRHLCEVVEIGLALWEEVSGKQKAQ
jgi:hypothetical protein